ncbi:uncharacterized protein A4U43_C02F18100 [Asparagus officinalis]|uniref:DNA topoisomerase I eukaryotic-type domain-containing protein n=1 Tax=Asparagus officinalis TaxID=4686 RepID=A0A5P1FKW8_ASPOF|nr:uncharacterized protein A4U43_C02F18100 [Asparagus officinalis]
MSIAVPHRQLFIGGEWREPVLGKRIPIINPATEATIGDIPTATEEDVNLAVSWLEPHVVQASSKIQEICLLFEETKEGTLAEKNAIYQIANKEVAIICNHQRSFSKSHDAQMSRLNEKIDELKGMLHSRGELLLMLDADGATKVTNLEKLESQIHALAEEKEKLGSQATTLIDSRHKLSDMEIVYLCKHLKIPMIEVSVNWSEIPGSKVRLTSVVHMLFELVVIRLGYGLSIWKIYT